MISSKVLLHQVIIKIDYDYDLHLYKRKISEFQVRAAQLKLAKSVTFTTSLWHALHE